MEAPTLGFAFCSWHVLLRFRRSVETCEHYRSFSFWAKGLFAAFLACPMYVRLEPADLSAWRLLAVA
jgi:hypothetical protein